MGKSTIGCVLRFTKTILFSFHLLKIHKHSVKTSGCNGVVLLDNLRYSVDGIDSFISSSCDALLSRVESG